MKKWKHPTICTLPWAELPAIINAQARSYQCDYCHFR